MTDLETALNDMYEMGVEHGRMLAEKDLEVKNLESDIEQLENLIKEQLNG